MERFSENPHNQRQIRLMENEIDKFMRGDGSLGNLVKQLKGLFWALQSPDDNWRDNFLSEWGALETTNALDLDRRERGLTSEKGHENPPASSAFVTQCVERIRQIVHGEIRA
jgi:hypothetical protein